LSEHHNVSNRLDVSREKFNILKWKLYEVEKVKDDIEKELERVTLELEIKQKTFDKLEKVKNIPVRYQNVGVVLSNNCIAMIEHNSNRNCPTYGQLFENFDNTNPLVSGTFSETTNDIKREKPQYENHWKWYVDYPTIIMVDPDVQFKNRNITIEIQARGFYSFDLYDNRKNSWDGRTIITYPDVKFSHDCKTILVAPDMELITRVIGYAATGCVGDFELDPNIKYIKKTPKPWTSSYFTYDDWLSSVKENYEKYMN
jgi:hypothetical protein